MGVTFEKPCPGTSMVKMTATDPDEGLKVEIKYGFAAQSTHIQLGLDHQSGEIKTLSTLDYKEVKRYSIV